MCFDCLACETHRKKQYLRRIAVQDLNRELGRLDRYVGTLDTRAQVDSFRIRLKELLNDVKAAR